MIPVSAIVATRNESGRIARCLSHLKDFSEIVVVDSMSEDGTAEIARDAGARAVSFSWNGRYPKKRQWCLDTLDLQHDWVFFVDADEVVTHALSREISDLFAGGNIPGHAGYFIGGRYVMDGQVLRFGLANSKLVLFDRRRFEFPVVDDLDLPGMGEIEGHYQPVLRAGAAGTVGALKEAMLHEAYGPAEAWEARHRRYAAWEAGMNNRNAWPRDPVPARQALKIFFRAMPCRAHAAFLHSYIWKRGFLDGGSGFRLAADRFRYYRMVAALTGGKRGI